MLDSDLTSVIVHARAAVPSLPPLNLTLISLSMYFVRSRMFSFLGFSLPGWGWVFRPPRVLSLTPPLVPLFPLAARPRKLPRSDIWRGVVGHEGCRLRSVGSEEGVGSGLSGGVNRRAAVSGVEELGRSTLEVGGCGLGRNGGWVLLGATSLLRVCRRPSAIAGQAISPHPIRSLTPRARPRLGMGNLGQGCPSPTLCSSEGPLPAFCRGNWNPPPTLVAGWRADDCMSQKLRQSLSSSQPTSSLSLPLPPHSRSLLLHSLLLFHLSSPALFRIFSNMDILLR